MTDNDDKVKPMTCEFNNLVDYLESTKEGDSGATLEMTEKLIQHTNLAHAIFHVMLDGGPEVMGLIGMASADPDTAYGVITTMASVLSRQAVIQREAAELFANVSDVDRDIMRGIVKQQVDGNG